MAALIEDHGTDHDNVLGFSDSEWRLLQDILFTNGDRSGSTAQSVFDDVNFDSPDHDVTMGASNDALNDFFECMDSLDDQEMSDTHRSIYDGIKPGFSEDPGALVGI